MIAGTEQVKAALISALEAQGLKALPADQADWAKSYSCPVAAVGLRTGESHVDAMASYLGQRTDPTTLIPREVYGLKSQLTLSLDLYAPPEKGAAGCDEALEKLHEALLKGLPSGLRVSSLRWEEAQWDPGVDMFLRRGSLDCVAYFLASPAEDGDVLTDFILKGVVTK